ncbi:hypothetical protein [Pseudonocardia acidicola]|uniref:Uncharacterized protein n=1 Tax=Pseudonocardia acidicola TaxID=2724939 RepID=A0ABX1S725_9PSEU|nr:hypothetical protein [Pseudonocardia acidicola]NMH96607.1 hypothetical protein [Pseudonocardia acidicola]
MTAPATPEGPEAEVVETALAVLAKKTRAELMLGLLEDFAAGQRTGRVVLEEFRRAEAALNADRPSLASRTGDGLRALVRSTSPDGPVPRSNRWLDAARRITTGGAPEWERLRQVGRDKDDPVPEWEIFHGLHALARRSALPGRRTSAGLSVQGIEEAMDLHGGLGASWSLHTYLREIRNRFGPDYRPGDPAELASTVLRIDAARQLVKPGGFTVGIRPGPAAPTRMIDEATMRAMTENYREVLASRLSATAGLELVRSAASGRNGQKPAGADVDRALAAGAAIVRARRARATAERVRERAVELRSRRIASGSTALFATAGVTGLGLTAVGLFGGLKFQYTTVIGLTMSAMGMVGNTLKEWTPNAEVIAAPFRAWLAEHLAARAQRAADHAIDRLYRGPAPVQSAWARARAAVTGGRSVAIAAAPRSTAQSGASPVPRLPERALPEQRRRR